MKHTRHNSWHVKYGQWVTAGKIALATNAMPEITAAVQSQSRTPVGDYNIYCTDTGEPHYSIIGQEYLRRMGINIYTL
jgi:hypothetical protein